MKTLTIADIRNLRPCHDPIKFLPETWSGTIIDILDIKECSFEDRLWVILHTEFVSDKLMRLFAVWCARQVQHLMTDARSITALDVAEKFANGLATKDELFAARYAARTAARDAALDAARDAAWYAASDAAWYAARDAALDAALDAASDAAWYAASDAVWYAAWYAARYAASDAAWTAASDAAWTAAWAAAWTAARTAQEIQLRKMILAGSETGDVK